MNKLTQDVTYFGPLCLPLQDQSEFGTDMNVADVVQQDPDHTPGQMHEAAEAHELTELERGQTFRRSIKKMCLNHTGTEHYSSSDFSTG